MAFDAYLKLDGINGEATDDKHVDWIGLHSWGFSLSFFHEATGPQGRGGRAEFGPISVMKTVDIASPELYRRCVTGTPIEKATLALQSATGTDKVDFLVIELEDVHITGINPGGSSDAGAESVSLTYGLVKWSYTQLDQTTGAKKGSDTKGYDLRAKKPL